MTNLSDPLDLSLEHRRVAGQQVANEILRKRREECQNGLSPRRR